MSITRTFQDMPVLCWAIDDWEQFREAIQQVNPNFDLSRFTERYRQSVYETQISPLFEGASIKLNLGGENEKVKIITTEKPTGIFDFSLAAKGLYRVQEYYSEKLATEFPDKFKGYQLISGLVPPNLVKETYIDGMKAFYYEDSDGFFMLTKQQKGTAEMQAGVQGAKLKYATKTKKVYLNYKRQGGKVKYVEIYSLFYYAVDGDSASLRNDLEYAIRHIPAIMVAEYLESMGVMTRLYMTRFVRFDQVSYLKSVSDTGATLPMYNAMNASQNNNFRTNLFVQPIIVKEFGQELDKSFAFSISSEDRRLYETMARYALTKELTNGADFSLYGYPIFNQDQYFVGIERYRNKYKQYVDLGIFKSKEVLPEAMLFFHDESIAKYLHFFVVDVTSIVDNLRNRSVDESEALADADINPFFAWWMKLSANTLKDKINIVNSNELQKDLVLMKSELEKMLEELQQIYSNSANITITRTRGYTKLKSFFEYFANNILQQLSIYNSSNEFTFRRYIEKITTEITTYADRPIYETEAETKEKRDQLATDVFAAISSM